MNNKKFNLISFYQTFPNEKACVEYLEKRRWGGDPTCPHCGAVHAYRIETRLIYKCRECSKQFSVRTGTIFEESRLPLQKWLLTIYMATSLKKGISSVQLSKYIDVTQKTAWFMLHRIRTALDKPSDKLDGEVEVDETYIGGKNPQRVAYEKKGIVFGAIEREGFVRTKHVKSSGSRSLIPIIYRNINMGSIIYSDEWHAYKRVAEHGYLHATVNHSAREFARAEVYTNTIENFWSHLKRGLGAIYIHVSKKHLDRYCKEYEYRHNTRKMTDFERFENYFDLMGGRIKYKELIA